MVLFNFSQRLHCRHRPQYKTHVLLCFTFKVTSTAGLFSFVQDGGAGLEQIVLKLNDSPDPISYVSFPEILAVEVCRNL